MWFSECSRVGGAWRSQSLWFCPRMDVPDSCMSEPRSNMLPKVRTILRVKNIHNPCKLAVHDLTSTMEETCHTNTTVESHFFRKIYTSLNHALPFHIPLPHLVNVFQKMKLGSYREIAASCVQSCCILVCFYFTMSEERFLYKMCLSVQ